MRALDLVASSDRQFGGGYVGGSGQRRDDGVDLGNLLECRRFVGRCRPLRAVGGFAGGGARPFGFRTAAARSKFYRQTDSGGSIRRWRHFKSTNKMARRSFAGARILF